MNIKKFVTVHFDNSDYDYTTKVNNKSTTKEINSYFINQMFQVSNDDLERCISINIHTTTSKA